MSGETNNAAAAFGSRRSDGSARWAWFSVLYLSLLFAISYVDRFILALLAAPVANDLGLSDTQLGLLLGAGFALLYSCAGVPIAYALDRGNRVRIIAAGVLIWSFSTAAGAFADGFLSLLVSRAGVAIGEAVLLPGAISLIADLFDERDRFRPTAVFAATGSLMGGGAFIVGAAALELAAVLAPQYAPGMALWRITLLIVGAPGLLLAVALPLIFKDPPRRLTRAHGSEPSVQPRLLDHVRLHGSFYAFFWLSIGAVAAISLAAVAWIPSLLQRAYDLETADAGYLFGIAALPAGLCGTFFWAWFAERINRRYAPGMGPVAGFASGACLVILASCLLCLRPALGIQMALVAMLLFGSAVLTVLPAMCVHAIVPANLRATVASINVLAANLIGLSVGPLVVPILSGFWPEDEAALARGLSLFALIAAAVILPSLWMAFRGLRSSLGANHRGSAATDTTIADAS